MGYKTVKMAVVALGANLDSAAGGPETTLQGALAAIRDVTSQTLKTSHFYRTPAYPVGSGPDFVNAVTTFPWGGTPQALLQALHRIERQFGRTRNIRWEARILDLDLIGFGDTILPDQATEALWRQMAPDSASVETPDTLILPHPRLAERGFVLVPLAEIAPDWQHPATGMTAAEMVADLPEQDRASIRPL